MSESNLYGTFSTGTPLDIVGGVTKEWSTISSSNVLSHVQLAADGGNPYVVFAISAIDKSSAAAQIKSRDTDSPAKLTLVVNNVQKSYTVSEDSYISAGRNSSSNYGREEILLAREHGYWGHWDNAEHQWGAEASATNRTYIKFDITGITDTDDITSAVLEFTAR